MTREDVDAILADLTSRWELSIDSELPEGYCSRVFATRSKVLKIPWRGEERQALWAVSELEKVGGPKVFKSDAATGSILMDRAIPGSKLSTAGLSDDECVDVTAKIAETLRPLPHHLAIQLPDYLYVNHPLLDYLLSSTEIVGFLHGDLHHENILLHGDSWIPIDPKGLSGDPAFEMSAFLRNPIGIVQTWPDLDGFTATRIQRFSEKLKLDPWRIAAWSALDRISIAHELDTDLQDDRLYHSLVDCMTLVDARKTAQFHLA